jgi:hypothetical protein
MQNPLRTVAFLFVVGLLGVGLGACDQGGSVGPLTAEEARSRIVEGTAGLQQAATALSNSAVGAFAALGRDADDDAASRSAWGQALVSGLGAVLDTTGGSFNYEASTGVYAWRPAPQAWTPVRPADSLILRFPAPPEATGDTATFVLGAYEAEAVGPGTQRRVPTRLAALLSVDGETAARVNLRDVTLSPVLQLPQSLSLTVALPPLDYTASLESPNATTFDVQDRLENDGQQIVSTAATVDVGGGSDEPVLGTATGTTQIGTSLAVEYTVSLDALGAFSEGIPPEDVNEAVDIRVLSDGSLLATLRYDAAAEQWVLEYPDGETEPLADLRDSIEREKGL